MQHKQGQAALEFLMTYGWAIVVVLVAIGALAYSGALNPSKTQSNRCMSQAGLGCMGMPIISDTMIAFTLANAVGSGIHLSNTSEYPSRCSNIYFCDQGNITCTAGTKDVEDGGLFTVVTNCNIESSQIKEDFFIKYTKGSSSTTYSGIITVAGRVS
ncbi:MAG: hypothetical protein WC916_07470 [Candidatus Woesearchaeota archaeon]